MQRYGVEEYQLLTRANPLDFDTNERNGYFKRRDKKENETCRNRTAITKGNSDTLKEM